MLKSLYVVGQGSLGQMVFVKRHPHECQNQGYHSRMLYCRQVIGANHFSRRWS